MLQLIGWTLSVSALLLSMLAACSSTSERFDHRPPICKDLGKRDC